MATLWITEYAGTGLKYPGRGYGAEADYPREPALTTQKMTYGTDSPVVSVQSSAFNSATRLVRLQSDTKCHVLFGDVGASPGPVADTADMILQANTTEYVTIDKDSVTGLAAYPAA